MASISQLTALRTNINSFGGRVVSLGGRGMQERVSSAALARFGDNSIDKFYSDLSELKQYSTSKICTTSSGIIEEYINKFRTESGNVVSITKDGNEIPESKTLNELFKSVNFTKSLFQDHLNDYIQFGSELLLIKVPKSGKTKDAYLENIRYPYSSIVHRVRGKDEIYVNGVKLDLTCDDGFYLPIRIGKLDVELDENVSYSGINDTGMIVEEKWLASAPLFYGLVTELKLFILKDILSSLIQIQDIVSPNLLLTQVDKNTSQEKATELSSEIEKLINQYGDLTQLLASNADINTLSQFTLNNVRVYPDMLGAINGTNKLDFTRLKGNNGEIRNELETQEGQLINAIGIPIDLYKGNATNKYDALSQSDRLLSRVSSEMHTIDDSIVEFTKTYLKGIGKWSDGLSVVCNLFDYSFIDSINSNYRYTTSTQSTQNLSQLAVSIKDTIEQTYDIFDPDKLYKRLTDEAEKVYPGIKGMIRPDFIKKLKKSHEAEEMPPEDQSGGEDQPEDTGGDESPQPEQGQESQEEVPAESPKEGEESPESGSEQTEG